MDINKMMKEFMSTTLSDPRIISMKDRIMKGSTAVPNREEVGNQLTSILKDNMINFMKIHGCATPEEMSSGVLKATSEPINARQGVLVTNGESSNTESNKLISSSSTGRNTSPVSTVRQAPTMKEAMEQNDHKVSGTSESSSHQTYQQGNTSIYKQVLAAAKESRKSAVREMSDAKMKKVLKYLAYTADDEISSSEEEEKEEKVEDLMKISTPFTKYQVKLPVSTADQQVQNWIDDCNLGKETVKSVSGDWMDIGISNRLQVEKKAAVSKETIADKINSVQCSEDEMDNDSYITANSSTTQLSEGMKTASNESIADEIDSASKSDISGDNSPYNLDEYALYNPRSEDGEDESSCLKIKKTVKEELLEYCIAKGMRPQFISDRYLNALANAQETSAEIETRKPEPRVKIDKPVRLDTDLMYAVRQSLKRTVPKVAGRNNVSALMVMADGMFDEMSLDRDLDDLAWPIDPLAELRASGLALVDYMDPSTSAIGMPRDYVSPRAETPVKLRGVTTDAAEEISESTLAKVNSEKDKSDEGSAAASDSMTPNITPTGVQEATLKTSVSNMVASSSESRHCIVEENIVESTNKAMDHTATKTEAREAVTTNDKLQQPLDDGTPVPVQHSSVIDHPHIDEKLSEDDVLSDDSALGEEVDSISSLDDTLCTIGDSSGYEDPSTQHIADKINFFNTTFSTSFNDQRNIATVARQDVSVSSAVHLFERLAVEEKSPTTSLIPPAQTSNEEVTNHGDAKKTILQFEEIKNAAAATHIQPDTIRPYIVTPKTKVDIGSRIKMFETMSRSESSARRSDVSMQKAIKRGGGLVNRIKVSFFENLSLA